MSARTLSLLGLTASLCATAGAAPLDAQQHQIRLEWSKNLTEYRGQNGRRLTHVCPPQGQLMAVTGTDTYTDDSGACSAAVHAGLITVADGGVVTIVIGPGKKSYAGSARNGVTSQSFGSWWGSFSFAKGAADGQIDWGTSAVGVELAGRPVSVVCPPGGESQTVWGTDIYRDDSPICVAAVHAGLITFAAGGHVTVEDAGGQQSYAASERNGVQSRSYGNAPTGFRFSGAGSAATASAESAPQSTVAPASSSPTPVTSTPVTSTPATAVASTATVPPAASAPTTTVTTAPTTGITSATTTVARAPVGTRAESSPNRFEPTTLQLTTVAPERIEPFMKVAVNGFALAAADTTTQKVYVHFKLARANNTSGSWVTVELPAGYASLGDSHSASVIAPSLQQLTGYDKEWVFSEASLYVVKGGERSNSLPIRYCSSNPMAPKPSIPGTC